MRTTVTALLITLAIGGATLADERAPGLKLSRIGAVCSDQHRSPRLRVRVEDALGLPIPGALVSLVTPDRGASVGSGSTDDAGIVVLEGRTTPTLLQTTLNGFHPDSRYIQLPDKCEGQVTVVLAVASPICTIDVREAPPNTLDKSR